MEDTPDGFIQEVLDLILLLKTKLSQEKQEALFLSESSLAKDLLKPEEDEAWQNL